MDHFSYKKGLLHAEEVSLPAIAEAVGTPFYCYSSATLERHYKVFAEQVAPKDALICFAVKANSNIAVLRTLGDLGAGADVVSEGEIHRALAAGISPQKIVFSGVGKTCDEMAFALRKNIYQFNVESAAELHALNEAGKAQGVRAPIALRVDPDVDPGTHAKISTGRKESKFGVEMDEAQELYKLAATMQGIKIQGISVHIGSQLLDLKPFGEAFRRVRSFLEELRATGLDIRTLDLGGGFGIRYGEEKTPSLEDYAAIVKEATKGLNARLIFEPGRVICGNAGILVTRVIYVKEGSSRRFIIADAAMNDLIRPTLYHAKHEVVHVEEAKNDGRSLADLVGPVCETGDILAEQQLLPQCNYGELLAIRTTGAYGAVMSGTYNTRPLVPEVLVKGKEFAVVRPRQSLSALLDMDAMAKWQKS